MKAVVGLSLAACLGLGAAALAAAPPLRLRGTIDSVKNDTLMMTSRTGSHYTVAIPAKTAVIAVRQAALSDVKKGDFIGTAAVPGPNGTLSAQEVTIFPEAMRGAGEGHYDWDTGAHSSMTNAAVASVVGTSDRTLTLDYPGGEQHVVVAPSAPVVTLAPGQPGLLVPGAHVIVFAQKAADGTLSALRLAVGEGGVTPPM
jgi:Cu/Ag efflux protein CusF